MNKLIIEARVNEYAMRDRNPNVPWTPDEITGDAAECREAGAAIVHFHARQSDGAPGHDAGLYAESIARIHETSDIRVHPTLGFVTLDAPPEEQVGHVVELAREPRTRPDFAPMDTGSTNIDRYDAQNRRFFTTDLIYKNSTGTLQHFAKQIGRAGIKHILVSWNIGFTRQALALMDLGLVPEPAFLLFVLTDGEVLAGHSGTEAGLDAHLAFVPEDRRIEWAVCNFGGDMLPLVEKIIAAGGHVSIGLGDYPYDELGQPSNADLVRRVSEQARAMGREVATPEETRAILEMA